MARRWGYLFGLIAVASIAFSVGAGAKPTKTPQPDIPKGAVFLAEGKVHGRHWTAYLMKQGTAACAYLAVQGTYFSCSTPASWIPQTPILIGGSSGSGPPWIVEGL